MSEFLVIIIIQGTFAVIAMFVGIFSEEIYLRKISLREKRIQHTKELMRLLVDRCREQGYASNDDMHEWQKLRRLSYYRSEAEIELWEAEMKIMSRHWR